MFSVLRKGLVYKDISPDVVEHDLDIDADQWSYDGKDVFRGIIDPEYISQDLNVYWLYDDNARRIGLTEHEANDPAVFKSLWFYDNPYATLLQDPSWKSSDRTVWSMLSNEAYQDCLETDFKHIHDQALNSGTLFVTPNILIEKPDLFVCSKCNKKSLVKSNVCSTAEVFTLDFQQFSILFLDDDFVIYEKPTTLQQPDACEQEPQEQSSQSDDLQESLDAELPHLQEPNPLPE
jgi:hypothetical protein